MKEFRTVALTLKSMKLKRIMQTVTLRLLMTIMIIAFSCKKNEDSNDSASARKTAPVAIAANDQSFFLPNNSTVLDGRSTLDLEKQYINLSLEKKFRAIFLQYCRCEFCTNTSCKSCTRYL